MTRLTDGKKVVEISMYGETGTEWSADFYEVGNLKKIEAFIDGGGAYVVKDVDYCLEQLDDYRNGIGDFSDCGATDDEILAYNFIRLRDLDNADLALLIKASDTWDCDAVSELFRRADMTGAVEDVYGDAAVFNAAAAIGIDPEDLI